MSCKHPLSSVNGYAHALRHTILPVLARQSSTRRQIVVTGNISMSQLFFSRMNWLLKNVCNSIAMVYLFSLIDNPAYRTVDENILEREN